MNSVFQISTSSYTSAITSGNSKPLHSHSQVELTHVISGSLQYKMREQIFTLKADDVILVFPFEQHSITCLESGCMTVISFDIDFITDFTKIFTDYKLNECLFHDTELNSATYTALKWLRNTSLTMEYKSQPVPLKERGWLIVILGDMFHIRALAKRTEKLDYELILSLFAYIDTHISEELNYQSVASALGISTYYLSHTLSKLLHTTFTSLLISYKLKLAEDLLISTSLSIIDIALEAGFHNAQTFARNFKRKNGITPSEFRKKALQKN